MAAALYYLSTCLSILTFLAFGAGSVLFRHVPVWSTLYRVMFVGYSLIYGLDIVGDLLRDVPLPWWALWLREFGTFWTFKHRQIFARLTICLAMWLPILLYLRNPRLLIDLYRSLGRGQADKAERSHK